MAGDSLRTDSSLAHRHRRRGHARGRDQGAAHRCERSSGGVCDSPPRAGILHDTAGGARTLDGGTRHRRHRRQAWAGEPERRGRSGCARARALHKARAEAEGSSRNDMTATPTDDLRRLVTALGLPFVESHISYVLLGGEHAYKVKKAVNLEFLDFTTLEKRRFYCREEL